MSVCVFADSSGERRAMSEDNCTGLLECPSQALMEGGREGGRKKRRACCRCRRLSGSRTVSDLVFKVFHDSFQVSV